MPITIKDIAEAADVSHTTVSRALKGRGRISPQTAQRIRLLAREMGYAPSAVAQSLVTRRTFTIGVVVTTIADPFVVNIVNGIEDAAQMAGYSVFLSSSHNDPERELAVVNTFYQRRVDAVIVTASRVGSLYAEKLKRFQVPIVLVNNQQDGEYLHSVLANDTQGACLAARHLLDLGHRRIAFIGSHNRPYSSRRRQSGIGQALVEAGVPFSDELIVIPPVNSDVEAGQQGLAALRAAQPTAIITYNDMTAVGVLLEARKRGLRIPQDISLVGFDDIELTSFVDPLLTTIRQPRESMGRAAVEMVLALLEGEEASDRCLPCELVVRQSTQSLSSTAN